MAVQPLDILQSVFGFSEFRPLQAEIIDRVLQKRDMMVVMPTGGGKSLCYQIPALIFDGLTVVVSPLISLMKDQVDPLLTLDIPAAYLNSSLTGSVYNATLQRVLSGEIKLLYISPETLLKPHILNTLKQVNLDCLTIDEAHCISEWGHDFRPEYRQLIGVRERFHEAVCLALTATATPRVQHDIKSSLGIADGSEVVASFDRPNLFLQAKAKSDAYEQMFAFIRQFPNQPGIIYCATRRQVDILTERLAEDGFSVRSYHAGLTDLERSRNQEAFIRDDVTVIVATIAFGMGIDKPDIRFIVHYDLPKNLEGYYQEIGRSGRDGLRADCLLLYSYGDVHKIRHFFKDKDEQNARVAAIQLDAMLGYAETDTCRRQPLLRYFGETYTAASCDMCDNCLVDEQDLEDLTVAAQKFMSCVKRTGEIFGAGHIIDVLRGSKAKKVLDRGHDRLSTYGIGMEFSKKQWFHISRQLVQKDLLVQDAEYGSLKITEAGWTVMRGQAVFKGRVEEDVSPTKTQDRQVQDYDRDLFQMLRQQRKSLADGLNLPPYAVFPDQTLIEMAYYYPHTEDDLLAIHGVGQVKLQKYGAFFLEWIGDYCQAHDIQPRPVRPRSVSRPASRGEKKRFEEVGELFNAGKSVAHLCGMYQIQAGTVISHLDRYQQAGHALRCEGLAEICEAPAEVRQAVFKAFDQMGAHVLKPIFEALDQNVSYDQLRVLKLMYLQEGS